MITRRGLLKTLLAAPLIKVAKYLPEPIRNRILLTDVVAATLRARHREVARNMQNHNALLNKLQGRPNPPDMPKQASWYDDRRGL